MEALGVDADIEIRLGTFDLQVQLTVQPGEVLAILGPNGAGKSTLLRALAGLISIGAGRIAIDGESLDEPSSGVFVPAEHRPIGVVFQDYLLFSHLSAIDNVAFGLRARGVAKAAARATARDWLTRVGLGDHADRRPRSLSGGQAQRVALARALATNPRLLLLDEPLAALDVGTRSGVRRDLRRHLESFDGMRVMVTHDPVDAYALADRVAILDAGRVVQIGTISEVTAHPRSRYVADLVGTNLVVGTADGGELVTDSGARVVIADLQPGRSFAVIRPQTIIISRHSTLDSSARNLWQGVVGDIDRMGDRVRIGIEGQLALTAEITSAALESLQIRPGDMVFASAKATDIEAYPV
ncbi:MAG: ABC transporter ATP-binding protein [Ilumatobacteraceae bacterium]